ncbi:hypothetical protein F5880DRAFT_1593954 [Lentinula raphanica]|nr:hypothetical protein F5880DRAFT_1593954 [Lentinula raphanica]
MNERKQRDKERKGKQREAKGRTRAEVILVSYFLRSFSSLLPLAVAVFVSANLRSRLLCLGLYTSYLRRSILRIYVFSVFLSVFLFLCSLYFCLVSSSRLMLALLFLIPFAFAFSQVQSPLYLSLWGGRLKLQAQNQVLD